MTTNSNREKLTLKKSVVKAIKVTFAKYCGTKKQACITFCVLFIPPIVISITATPQEGLIFGIVTIALLMPSFLLFEILMKTAEIYLGNLFDLIILVLMDLLFINITISSYILINDFFGFV